MNNIPTHILIRDANEFENKKYEDSMASELAIIELGNQELENRYQSIKAELEAYEEFTLLSPHQLL